MCAGVLPPKGLWDGGQGEKPALVSSCHPLAPDRRPDRLRSCLGKRPAPLCSAGFLLLLERQHREQGREGREPGGGAATAPPPKSCVGDSAGGMRCPSPCAEKLPRRPGWKFLCRKPHGPLSSGESFLGVFHAALAVLGKANRWVTPASPAPSVPCPKVLYPGGNHLGRGAGVRLRLRVRSPARRC